jgi:uncharacterized surface protein with fasciclin (FAS1) repeats
MAMPKPIEADGEQPFRDPALGTEPAYVVQRACTGSLMRRVQPAERGDVMRRFQAVAALGAMAVGMGSAPGVLGAQQDTVVVRKDTVVTVTKDTVVKVRKDTSIVATTVTTKRSTPPGRIGTIAATLQEMPNYTVLTSLLEEAHLLPILRSGAKFTVFAPNDDAFRNLPVGELDHLRADTAQLKKLLLHHIVSGVIDVNEILHLKTAKTLEGSGLTFSYENGHPKVSGAVIVQPGIVTRNGTIHGIASVIMP